MLSVFLTVEVEVWCDCWSDIDGTFPDAFESYDHGKTTASEFGLRYQAEVLRSHGLVGVFFVEPLFSGRFGLAPLTEIVSLLRDDEQAVQIHLHTEWLDEWAPLLLPGPPCGRQFLRDFSLSEQRILIDEGVRRLRQAGGAPVNCFHAGSFGFNAGRLDALLACGIPFDSSYNISTLDPSSGVAPGMPLNDIHRERGITADPMSVYHTGGGRLQHVQLTACSWTELQYLLRAAVESEGLSFVLLSHDFELLAPSRRGPDSVVGKRFWRLCSFLDLHHDSFEVRGFHGPGSEASAPQGPPLRPSPWRSALRIGEQIYRRRPE
jgi:hypothetical protein